MTTTTIRMLKADEGKALVKDGRYCRAVTLAEGDDGAGWEEVPIAEADAAVAAAAEQRERLEAERRAARRAQDGQGGAQ